MATTDPPVTPQVLLWAYSQGIFPMADSRDGQVHWYSPDPRAILPLDGLKVRKSLRRVVKKQPYDIVHDRAFREVMTACAQPRSYERETWISEEIIDGFCELHEAGFAHSVEAWSRPETPDQEPELVGGLYGASIGGAFFGESMFSRQTDASKVCLVHLVEHLNARGYALLDVQFNSDHMSQFGVTEIPRDDYLQQLQRATSMDVAW